MPCGVYRRHQTDWNTLSSPSAEAAIREWDLSAEIKCSISNYVLISVLSSETTLHCGFISLE